VCAWTVEPRRADCDSDRPGLRPHARERDAMLHAVARATRHATRGTGQHTATEPHTPSLMIDYSLVRAFNPPRRACGAARMPTCTQMRVFVRGEARLTLAGRAVRVHPMGRRHLLCSQSAAATAFAPRKSTQKAAAPNGPQSGNVVEAVARERGTSPSACAPTGTAAACS
jgi:hypothetical protein